MLPIEKIRSVFQAQRPPSEKSIDMQRGIKLKVDKAPDQMVVRVVDY